MKPVCIGKSDTNILRAPTDLTQNPNAKKVVSEFPIQIIYRHVPI
jgi:hypothetical protein